VLDPVADSFGCRDERVYLFAFKIDTDPITNIKLPVGGEIDRCGLKRLLVDQHCHPGNRPRLAYDSLRPTAPTTYICNVSG